MGCQVQLSTEQPYFRTDKVKVVSILHVVRAVVYISLSFIVDDVFMTLVWIGLADLFVGWWFWGLRMESWGLAMGVCVVQFMFPISIQISLVGGAIILIIAAVEMAVLGLIRKEGGYSYNHFAYLDQAETRDANIMQRRMFQLAVSAQFIKSLFVIVGGFTSLLFLGWFDPVPWLQPIPLIPLTLLLGIVNLIAGYGFFSGRDWGFHFTVTMIPVSFIETMLTLNGLVFLLGIWIFTMLVPCLARDGFYSKLFKRIRNDTVEHTQEVIKTQEQVFFSDTE